MKKYTKFPERIKERIGNEIYEINEKILDVLSEKNIEPKVFDFILSEITTFDLYTDLYNFCMSTQEEYNALTGILKPCWADWKTFQIERIIDIYNNESFVDKNGEITNLISCDDEDGDKEEE